MNDIGVRKFSEIIWSHICKEEQFQLKDIKEVLAREEHLTYKVDYDSRLFSNAIATLVKDGLIEQKNIQKDGIYVVIGKAKKEKDDELEELKSLVMLSINDQCNCLESLIENKSVIDFVQSENRFNALNDIAKVLKYLKKFRFS